MENKRSYFSTILKGTLIGFLCGALVFGLFFALLTYRDESVKQGITGMFFRSLGYVPDSVFSFCVDRGILSMHDGITYMFFMGIWIAFVFAVIGSVIAFVLKLREQKLHFSKSQFDEDTL